MGAKSSKKQGQTRFPNCRKSSQSLFFAKASDPVGRRGIDGAGRKTRLRAGAYFTFGRRPIQERMRYLRIMKIISMPRKKALILLPVTEDLPTRAL